MCRWLALLASLSLLGCHAPSPPPTANIDSYRNAYFSRGPLPQVATVPQPDAAQPSESAPSADATQAQAAAPEQQSAAAPEAPAASTPTAAAQQGPRPPRYKTSVAAYIKRYAVDANSLKQAKIGVPFSGSVHGQKGSVVCVELDGIKADRTAYLLKDGAVADSEYGADECLDQHLDPWNDAGT